MQAVSKMGETFLENTMSVTNSNEDLKDNSVKPNKWIQSDMSLGASGNLSK